MAPQVYSLLATHRSHRIESPTLEGSIGTGKPHACNLCHLDKSLGWTRDQLARWPTARAKTATLSEDEERLSAAVLNLSEGDARTRVIVAGAFANLAAQQAAGTDWHGSFLTRLMADERYPAVRYLAHKALKSVHGESGAGPFDFLARSADRERQLQALRERYDANPVRRPTPFLPLTAQGLPDDATLRRLRDRRIDPDLTINE